MPILTAELMTHIRFKVASLAYLLLAVSALALSSCSKERSLKVVNYPDHDVYASALDKAPIALVANIKKDEDLRLLKKAMYWPNHKAELTLHKLSIDIENVLRGQTSIGTATVYYFGFAGAYDGPGCLGLWTLPSRRVLFCRYESGLLRLFCDGENTCTIPVFSGKHTDIADLHGADLEILLAHILFTRGGDASDDRFALSLYNYCKWFKDCSSAVPQLLGLTKDSNPDIGKASCEVLEHFGKNDHAKTIGEACLKFAQSSSRP